MFKDFPDDWNFDGEEVLTICIAGVGLVVFCFCCGLMCCTDAARGCVYTASVPFGALQGDCESSDAADGLTKPMIKPNIEGGRLKKEGVWRGYVAKDEKEQRMMHTRTPVDNGSRSARSSDSSRGKEKKGVVVEDIPRRKMVSPVEWVGGIRELKAEDVAPVVVAVVKPSREVASDNRRTYAPAAAERRGEGRREHPPTMTRTFDVNNSNAPSSRRDHPPITTRTPAVNHSGAPCRRDCPPRTTRTPAVNNSGAPCRRDCPLTTTRTSAVIHSIAPSSRRDHPLTTTRTPAVTHASVTNSSSAPKQRPAQSLASYGRRAHGTLAETVDDSPSRTSGAYFIR